MPTTPQRTKPGTRKLSDLARHLSVPTGITSTGWPAVEATCRTKMGVEFDDWEGMERSCLEPGERRCRVFYCDAMKSNQKSEAERNHEQLRRILPKGRSDFDKLSAYDVATCCCHVNSYPSANRGGQSPFELLGGLLPQSLFDELGLARLDPDSVILKPYLMEHAVEQ